MHGDDPSARFKLCAQKKNFKEGCDYRKLHFCRERAHCHAIKNKIKNHAVDKVKKL